MNALPTPPIEYLPDDGPQPHRNRGLKIALWIGGALVLLILLIAIGITILLHNQSFHDYMLRTAQQKASEALGTQVQAQNYALRFSGISPTVDMYGVVIHGADPYPNPPLLQADHIGLSVRIVSLLQRKWYLEDVRLDHPVVWLFIDSQGQNNLPKSKSSGQSKTDVFELAVRHALLKRGEIYYNDRKTPLTADLHELEFQSSFDTLLQKYSGSLGYQNGHLQFGSYNSIDHHLKAKFAATPKVFTLDRTVLTVGSSQLTLDATVHNYVNPQIQASYEASLNSGDFRRILKNPSLPDGILRLNGKLQYQGQPNRPAINVVVLDGDMQSGELNIRTSEVRASLQDLSAHYALSQGNAEVRDLRARLLGGVVTGKLTIQDVSGDFRSHVQATLRNISVAEAKSAMTSAPLEKINLRGTVNATADATWAKTIDNLVAKADATIQGGVSSASKTSPGTPIPVNGVLHAQYKAATKEVTLNQSYLRTPQTSVNLNGTVSDRSALQLQLQTNDLHEVEVAAGMFSKPPAPPLALYGTASFSGEVRGSTTDPRVTGQLTASNVKARGSSWKVLRTNVDASSSQVKLQNGDLEPSEHGKIAFNLTASLHQWSFTNASPFEASVNAAQLEVAEFAKLANLQTPVSGMLTANISLHGTQLNPLGQGQINLTQARIAEEPIQTVSLNFQGNGSEVHANLNGRLPAGAVQAVLTYFPKQQGYDLQVRSNGIRLEQLQTVKQRNLQMTGVLNVNASGKGTLKDPQLQASLRIPQLKIQNQVISGLNLQANVADHLANVSFDSDVINTHVRGRGTVNLTGDYYADAVLDTQSIPLAPLVAAYAPAQAGNITGQTEIHGTLRGPLKNKNAVEAHITIPTLAVKYKNIVEIGSAAPIKADFANGVLTLQRTSIRGTDTNLQIQGSFPTASNQPISLLLLGTIDLRLAQLFAPDVSSAGQLQFDINSYGSRSDTNVEGQIRVVNASFSTLDVPVGLQNGNGVLTLTKDRLNITSFKGTVGSGSLTAHGGIVYRPNVQFDLALAGDGIRLLYPEGMRETFNTNLALVGNTDNAVLRGSVHLNQLSFTPEFDLNKFIDQFAGATVPPPSQGFSRNLQLDIGVQSTSNVNLVSRTLSIQGAANLRVQGTAAEPVILGRVNLNGGDLIFSGNRYILQNGVIDFVNPVQTQPVVNVAVDTTIQQYNIHMRLEGPVDHLRTNYASDPSLPPSDIINLLAFGKTTEASAANPNPPGNLGAESLIASGVSSQVTSRVEKIAGVSQLSVDPVLGGDQQNPGARVTIQQRVTGNLFVTFSTDVTSTQRQIIQVQYRYSPRISFSGTRDENGGFGFDTRIHKTW